MLLSKPFAIIILYFILLYIY